MRISDWSSDVCSSDLFSLTAGFFPVSAVASPVVADARIGVHQDYTRFVLELSAQLPYKIFTLPDHYRVVLDLPEVNWRAAAPEATSPVGLLVSLCYGLIGPAKRRVVVVARGQIGRAQGREK